MPHKQLSKNLITLRKLHQLTQEDLGEILHISRQAYSNYETCKRTPDLEGLMILSSLYHISIDELVNHDLKNEIAAANRTRNIAVDVSNLHTLYLTSDETDLLAQYRKLSKEKRSSVKSFVDSL